MDNVETRYQITYNGQGSAFYTYAELNELATEEEAVAIARALFKTHAWINEVLVTPWHKGKDIYIEDAE